MFIIARAGGMWRTDPPGQVGTGEQPPGVERTHQGSDRMFANKDNEVVDN